MLTIVVFVSISVLFRYGGYGSPGWNYGVRNFVFTLKKDGPLDVRSWIRYEEGEVKAQVKLEGSKIIVQST